MLVLGEAVSMNLSLLSYTKCKTTKCNKKQVYFFSSFMEYVLVVEKSLCTGSLQDKSRIY